MMMLVHARETRILYPQPDLFAGVSSELKLMEPREAREWRDAKHFERQRNISRKNVQRLAYEMDCKRFLPATQIFICRLPDGSERIINGNHTLEAIAASGSPQLLTVTKKDVASLDEAGRYYAVFDIHKVRTWSDSLQATGKDQELPNARHAAQAVGVIGCGFAQVSHSGIPESRLDRIADLTDYEDAAFLHWDAISGASAECSRLSKRAAIMAVALATLRYQPSFAVKFWRRFAQDDGLRVGMPERALLSYLRNMKGSSGWRARAENARAAALAWNAAFRSESREVIKPNAMTKFFLLGTPWEKGLRK